MPRLVISAFGVHGGGGLVLLRALLRAASGRTATVFLDRRVAGLLEADAGTARIVAVAPTVGARLRVLLALPTATASQDRLLCFNGLPPLRPVTARTVAFIQTRYFCRTEPVGYPRGVALRIAFERGLFGMGVRNCDELWVQTPTMAEALALRAVGVSVRVMPFADGPFAVASAAASAQAGRSDRAFFYPADAAQPKNHVTLLRAWALLEREGLRPPLLLTLSPAELARVLAAAGIGTAPSHVRALGRLAHDAVLARLDTHALIFPSRSEAFGLPLVEAAARGTPILAAEAPFVRDVCVPVQTFDPASARSIADAVRRFIGVPRPPVRPMSAEAFVDALLA